MRSKLFLALSLLIAASMVLAACAPSAAPAEPAAPAAPADACRTRRSCRDSLLLPRQLLPLSGSRNERSRHARICDTSAIPKHSIPPGPTKPLVPQLKITSTKV